MIEKIDIGIDKINKIYPNGKVAVNSVSFKL